MCKLTKFFANVNLFWDFVRTDIQKGVLHSRSMPICLATIRVAEQRTGHVMLREPAVLMRWPSFLTRKAPYRKLKFDLEIANNKSSCGLCVMLVCVQNWVKIDFRWKILNKHNKWVYINKHSLVVEQFTYNIFNFQIAVKFNDCQ